MSKTLFVSDLDGTLLDADSKISATSAQMLNEAIAEGALFSIATARTPATVAGLLKEVNLQIPAIVMTGVALWDRKHNTYHNVKHFDPLTVNAVRNAYESCGLPYFLYTLHDHLIRIYHHGPMSAPEWKFVEERINSPFKQFLIPESGTSEIPDMVDDAILFFAMQPAEPARKAFEILRQREDVNPMFYYDPCYGPDLTMSEAFPKAASKAQAVKTLAQKIGADKIVAFGDNMNDIPMLKAADVAVAVENAIPEVKAIADIIIGPHTADSVAKFILNYK